MDIICLSWMWSQSMEFRKKIVIDEPSSCKQKRFDSMEILNGYIKCQCIWITVCPCVTDWLFVCVNICCFEIAFLSINCFSCINGCLGKWYIDYWLCTFVLTVFQMLFPLPHSSSSLPSGRPFTVFNQFQIGCLLMGICGTNIAFKFTAVTTNVSKIPLYINNL